MAWIDDIQTRLEQSVNNQFNDINSYLKSRVTDVVVKIGEPPKGNLTTAQVEAGQTGQTPPVAAPAGGVQNVIQNQLSQFMLPLLVVAAVGFFMFSKKSRG